MPQSRQEENVLQWRGSGSALALFLVPVLRQFTIGLFCANPVMMLGWVTRTLAQKEPSIPSLPSIPCLVFQISGGKSQQPKSTSYSTSLALAPITAPSLTPSHHLSSPSTSNTTFKAEKFCLLFTEEQHTSKHQAPAHRSCWRQASVPEGQVDRPTGLSWCPIEFCHHKSVLWFFTSGGFVSVQPAQALH